ncbi:MAG: carbonic anhydrase [Polyangiaceae bacterium]
MQKLIDGLHKFQSQIFGSQEALFKKLSSGQSPEVLFITCSDSRINPNLLTQTNPGDLFILRNAGNLVPPYTDGNSAEAATIEFAVAGLGVKHIVICGHTLCGAMKGLLNKDSLDALPSVRAWLGHAEATRRVIEENYTHLEGEARLTAATEENVLAQIENLRSHPSVRSRIAKGAVAVYGWVYKIQTGEVYQFDHDRGQFARIADGGDMKPVPQTVLQHGDASTSI